jgi:hypothetical protein
MASRLGTPHALTNPVDIHENEEKVSSDTAPEGPPIYISVGFGGICRQSRSLREGDGHDGVYRSNICRTLAMNLKQPCSMPGFRIVSSLS